MVSFHIAKERINSNGLSCEAQNYMNFCVRNNSENSGILHFFLILLQFWYNLAKSSFLRQKKGGVCRRPRVASSEKPEIRNKF